MERVLVMSAQEVAQPASHEQTREEIRHIAHTSSNRLVFTALPLDRMLAAKKVQIYKGLMAYGDDDIWAQIPADRAVTPELLAQLGFSTEEDADTLSINTVAETGNGMVVRVEKRKIAIPLWAFSSRRDLPRNPNPEVAQAMLNFLIGALNNERIVQGAGMDQLIDMLNETLKVIGFPPDFKIRFTGQTPEEQQSEMMQVVGAAPAADSGAVWGPCQGGHEQCPPNKRSCHHAFR